MSEFSGDSKMKGVERSYAKVLNELENHTKLSSTLDKESLSKELIEYKKLALLQHDQIARYKVELFRVRKMAAAHVAMARKEAGLEPVKPAQRDSWVNKQDPNLLKPKDEEELKEEVKTLKKELHKVSEANIQLKLKCAKYEKKAKYAVDKFFELKKKEMQLISFGEQRVRSQMIGGDDKHKKTVETLKAKVKKLEQANEELKATKKDGRDFQTRFRADFVKQQKHIDKLEAKVLRLEDEKRLAQNEVEIQQDMTATMQ